MIIKIDCLLVFRLSRVSLYDLLPNVVTENVGNWFKMKYLTNYKREVKWTHDILSLFGTSGYHPYVTGEAMITVTGLLTGVSQDPFSVICFRPGR